FALQKYKKVSPEESQNTHQNFIPTDDPISKVKNHEFRYWKQRDSNDLFIRILPNYSSKSAGANIEQNVYKSFSNIFQMQMIIIPRNQILNHWKPQQRFKELLSGFASRNFSEIQKLDNLEREVVEVGITLETFFDIDISQIGITGSILWNAHHEKSDIDIMIYGTEFSKIVNSTKKLSAESKGLRRFKKIEILPLAEKMAIKTGLPMEECFEYIYKKNYLFFFNKRKVSITFAPNLQELLRYPLFSPETIFKSKKRVTIQAKIESCEFGYYYPSLYKISCEKIKDEKNYSPLDITRLIVYEHELVGYYKNGDDVEIRGLLQECINVPNFNDLNPIKTYQILVGGQETFGNEYIRLIK
ncbi:MAG: nucleotidyltransferase domain-containing protein, partial [Promethearchaeota archaeon]